MGPDRGLDDFNALSEQEKTRYRELAITHIRDECQKTGLAAIVAGHYMFWPRDSEQGTVVWTKADQDTFTHIVYLQVAAETLCRRRQRDQTRKREPVTPAHLHKWQEEEMRQLDAIAKDSGICFVPLESALINPASPIREISEMLHEYRTESEHYNHVRVLATVDEVLANVRACRDTKITTALVFDADKTLTAEDTGREFWKREASRKRDIGQQVSTPAEDIFREHGYTYEAFRQVAMSYSKVKGFEELCNDVAKNTTLYPEFLSLLRRVKTHGHVMALVVTCGLRQIWENVIEEQGLGQYVKVIGGGGIDERLIITDKSKEAVVNRLRGPPHNLRVVAFGDSPLDLPMLQAADEGIVVVGDECTRSASMEDALSTAIEQLGINGPPHGHNLRQTIIPHTVTPRLDTALLPVVDLLDPTSAFNQFLFGGLPSSLLHATDRPSAKLMATPTRDANISGPALREAHRRIGWYLATEFITSLVGLEEYSIPHVQGHNTTGHRLLHEQDTTIVALMRGGEPMAFGVNDAFPLAMFLHAKTPEDVKPHHLSKQHTIILVDSVVNNGKTVLEFRERIRAMGEEGKDIRVVVVAGVVQVEATGAEHELGRVLRSDGKFRLVALRVSDNKFTGRGGTDTGNRLFGTTRLD
ncbi:uracil phosphoribosyltransferase-domain-containing protein [Pseudoneurospora amorphoporcata]|uniref:Uracil phosphoribosyltransferase-domain-containing protein n=1 Tax=Pseudoneurospora amorphoporcata TaxID=241081 RepID=A0AAN6SC10_9PEZI|nr:uracil phosphoribosyltransferase-domain-containing protein [Pseudoneurospora amorphoporcata]